MYLMSKYTLKRNKTIEHDYQKKMEKIMGSMECPEDFACLQLGKCPHCKANGFKLENSVEVDGNGRPCKLLSSYGDTYFCNCPLNVYLTKNFVNRESELAGS